jgi:hypothetical protein
MPLIIVGLLAISNPWYNTIPYFYVNTLAYCLVLCMPFAILSKQTIIQRQFNRTAPTTMNTVPIRLMNTQATQHVVTANVITGTV